MATKTVYFKDSVIRALQHHERTGAITFLHIPEGGAVDTKFGVELAGLNPRYSLTIGEAHALTLGLAAAQRHYSRRGNDAIHTVLAEHSADADAPLSMDVVNRLREAVT